MCKEFSLQHCLQCYVFEFIQVNFATLKNPVYHIQRD
jgi:hypothetical protein